MGVGRKSVPRWGSPVSDTVADGHDRRALPGAAMLSGAQSGPDVQRNRPVLVQEVYFYAAHV